MIPAGGNEGESGRMQIDQPRIRNPDRPAVPFLGRGEIRIGIFFQKGRDSVPFLGILNEPKPVTSERDQIDAKVLPILHRRHAKGVRTEEEQNDAAMLHCSERTPGRRWGVGKDDFVGRQNSAAAQGRPIDENAKHRFGHLCVFSVFSG